MKVIIASLPKCGTKTLHRCLEILGYTVADWDHHAFEHRDEWKSILLYGNRKGQFYEMYKDVDVLCDFPASYFWEEIAEEFPDAKVILTTRKNESEWLRSFKTQMKMHETSWLYRLCYYLTPSGWKLRNHLRLYGRIIYGCPPQGLFQTNSHTNDKMMKRRYRDHNDSVLARCEKSRLLHFNFSDGWKPLCEFLEKDIPDIPFPHENKKGDFAAAAFELPAFKRMKTELHVVLGILFALCCSGVLMVLQ